ncbi:MULTISPECIES: MvdC/MvdD family ATP grasp protein [Exiguobacterium]|uniref:MvdC/MvdD family ATP grasp protein n=1 Tax=Exiguobacterium TaxID=33986 RepID=UPI001BECD16C|nr:MULTISPECIES: hypothetical protein [Exiguobacterium]MCT4793645.1 hypothetical protein [Exiguobacterium artemiae]
MILIITDAFDSHAERVISNIEAEGIPFFRFNLDVEALKTTTISIFEETCIIRQNDSVISMDDISVVWVRRAFVELTLEEMKNQSTGFKIWKNEWNKTLNGLYLRLKKKTWLNELNQAFKGENKYSQLAIAKKIGFNIPKTIVSNDKKALVEFSRNYDKVVFKLMTQDFYPDLQGGYQGLYVNTVNKQQLAEFSEIGENPIVLQEFIKKQYEVRYTVVAEKHFVCKIDSQASEKTSIDWRRYDIPNTPHFEITPPKEIVKKVQEFMRVLDLNYGAFDFVVTQENEWYFLEINCFGQWLWIEDLTGMNISAEISNWLIGKYTEKEVKSIESIRT